MSLISALAIYFLIWWLCLFVVLPWGVVTQAEAGDIVAGSAPSAPKDPHMLTKMIVTTALAGAIFAGLYLIVAYRVITLEDILNWW